MSENSPKPAILSWHLFIDCPECKEHVDLADLHSDFQAWLARARIAAKE